MTDQEINEAVARKLGWTHIFPSDEGYQPDFPDYCTDIKAAWEIVEFVHADERYSFNLYWHATEKVTAQIQEYLGMQPRREEKSFEACSDTAPMAICLAFLNISTKV